MSRFLFVVPPFAGHINPTLGVGRALRGLGHEVAWTGLAGGVEPLLPADCPFVAGEQTADAAEVTATLATMYERARALRGAAAFKFLWEDALLPLARAMVPEVRSAVDRFGPDVLVVDQQAFAGAIVARERHLPWATSATTSAELANPLRAMPVVDAWVRREMDQLVVDSADGVEPGADLRFSPHLIIAFTTRALVGDVDGIPEHVAFVGPSIDRDRVPVAFDLAWLDPDRPHVLVSLGTLNAQSGSRFFGVVVEALAGEPLQAVVVAPPGQISTDAENILVVPAVPQLDLLAHLDAVVTHGGHNTVCESLAAGVPLVVAPIKDDQPMIADQVVAAGAGVRVKFGRVRPEQLRDAVWQALTDPALRAGAAVVQASFDGAGGAPVAAEQLADLATTRIGQP